MPLIRYWVGDRGAFSERICSCGRGLPLLSGVEGRVLDVVRAPNGNVLGGTFWTLLFRSKPGINRFQVIQEDINGITVRYTKDPSVAKLNLEYFAKKISEKCGEDFRVDFQEVDEIGKTVSGKTRFVVSKFSEEPSLSLAKPDAPGK